MRSPLVVLRVRREQLARLSDEQVADFVGEIAPYICEVFAAEVERVAGGAPEAWMRRAVERGISFGVVSRRDLRRYVECAAYFGWRSGAPAVQSTAHAILARDDLDGPTKADRIEPLEASLTEGG